MEDPMKNFLQKDLEITDEEVSASSRKPELYIPGSNPVSR
jgi:hypothetical protein